MKKKVWICAGLTALCLTAGGCSLKSAKSENTVSAQSTPIEQALDIDKPTSSLVEMEKVEEPTEEKKVIGTQTETAVKMKLTNRTSDAITYLYIRNNASEDWGPDRIGGALTLEDGEKATLYFEREEGAELYDLRIGYADYNKSEYFFRKLPLDTMKEIALCLDTDTGDTIPYAAYKVADDPKAHSTLLEVKVRLGLLTEEEAQAIAAAEAEAEPAPVETETEKTASKSDAESCIGKTLKDLTALCGEPGKTTYKNEPETGKTGYHEYKDFTVSTTVEEDGNEIVAGVW